MSETTPVKTEMLSSSKNSTQEELASVRKRIADLSSRALPEGVPTISETDLCVLESHAELSDTLHQHKLALSRRLAFLPPMVKGDGFYARWNISAGFPQITVVNSGYTRSESSSPGDIRLSLARKLLRESPEDFVPRAVKDGVEHVVETAIKDIEEVMMSGGYVTTDGEIRKGLNGLCLRGIPLEKSSFFTVVRRELASDITVDGTPIEAKSAKVKLIPAFIDATENHEELGRPFTRYIQNLYASSSVEGSIGIPEIIRANYILGGVSWRSDSNQMRESK